MTIVKHNAKFCILFVVISLLVYHKQDAWVF